MFYVYAYKDPRPSKQRQVVYVGKGMGNRMWQHWKKRMRRNSGFGNFLALLRREKLEPVVEVVAEFVDEAEAFMEEMRLIEAYGRRDLGTGTLFNLTDGGEGFSGILHTPEWNANISAAHSTEERRALQTQATKALWNLPWYRAKVTSAIRKALKDPEVIARREAGKEAFIHTEEFRQTMQAATTKMWQDPEYAEKVVQRQKEGNASLEVRAMRKQNSKKMWQEKGGLIAARIKAGRSTEESRAKTRAQVKAQLADPVYVARQNASNKEIAHRPEVKAAKAAALKARWDDPIKRAELLAARVKKAPVDNS